MKPYQRFLLQWRLREPAPAPAHPLAPQVQADPAKALALYERAAAAGIPAARTALARLKQQPAR